MSEQYGPTDYYAVGRYVIVPFEWHGNGVASKAYAYEIERLFEKDGVEMAQLDDGNVIDYESLRARYQPQGTWDEYEKWENP